MVVVVHPGRPSYILSMSSIERSYALRTLCAIGGQKNRMSPSKEDGKYLTIPTSILSKSVETLYLFN